jgi:hypothetical protein
MDYFCCSLFVVSLFSGRQAVLQQISDRQMGGKA